MKNIVKVVIPARFGSQRLPGKPLADLGGRPLVVRVCDNVKKALPNIELVVATDDRRIADVVHSYGHKAVITSKSHINGTERIAEVATRLKWDRSVRIINLQGDEPLVPTLLIKDFYNFVISLASLELATICGRFGSVKEVQDKNKVKVVTTPNAQAVYFSRSPIPHKRDGELMEHDLKQYKKHIGIYAYSVSTALQIADLKATVNEQYECLEQLRAIDHGIGIRIFQTETHEILGVDTQNDLDLIRKKFYSEES